jgi:hypothetical protein
MYKTRVGACVDGAKAQLGYVETDPSGRIHAIRFFPIQPKTPPPPALAAKKHKDVFVYTQNRTSEEGQGLFLFFYN